MVVRTERWPGGWNDGRAHGRADGRSGGWSGGQSGGQTVGRTAGRTVGRQVGWLESRVEYITINFNLVRAYYPFGAETDFVAFPCHGLMRRCHTSIYTYIYIYNVYTHADIESHA